MTVGEEQNVDKLVAQQKKKCFTFALGGAGATVWCEQQLQKTAYITQHCITLHGPKYNSRKKNIKTNSSSEVGISKSSPGHRIALTNLAFSLVTGYTQCRSAHEFFIHETNVDVARESDNNITTPLWPPLRTRK